MVGMPCLIARRTRWDYAGHLFILGLGCIGVSCATYPCCGIYFGECPMISLIAEPPDAKKHT